MKKIISVFLAVVLIFSVFSAFTATAATKKNNRYPVILVLGRGAKTPYYDKDGNKIFPVETSSEFIVNALEECLPYLAGGLATGDLEPWADKVAQAIAPLYEKLIPNKEGVVENGGGPKVINGEGYPLTQGNSWYDYTFNYDWREDPCVSAKHLDEYIQQIKAAEKCDKVSLVGRCYGANVVAAYLYDYGHGDIDTVIFYCSTALGCYAAGCPFSGDITVDPRALRAFLKNSDIIEDEDIKNVLISALTVINAYSVLDEAEETADELIDKLFNALAPKVFLLSYGAMTCFWDMVEDFRYEKAKELIFSGREEEYAAFIQKIDHYHYDIMAGLPEMLTRYSSEGMKVGVVAKYGENAQYPVYDNGNPQSDNTVQLSLASFGSTCSKYGETLSKDYLENADMKYVSPDRCVDVSTALFKDSTWLITGADHLTFPMCVDKLIVKICNHNGQMTVWDDEAYPQFLHYDAEKDTLTADKEPEKTNIFSNLVSFVKNLIESIFGIFKKLLFSFV